MMNKVFAVKVENEMGDNSTTLFSTREGAQREFNRLLEENISLCGSDPDDYETKEDLYADMGWRVNDHWFYDGECYEVRITELEVLD